MSLVFGAWGKVYQRCNYVLKSEADYTNEYVRVGDRPIASAEGAKLRLPKARSPLRLYIGGLGERRKLPSGVWGGAPETEAILNISCEMEYIFGSGKIPYFLTITSKKILPKASRSMKTLH